MKGKIFLNNLLGKDWYPENIQNSYDQKKIPNKIIGKEFA